MILYQVLQLALLSALTALCLLALLCRCDVRRKSWHIPTRLTARIPCLDEELLLPGRTMDQEHSSTSLYRWVQADGNIIGSGFYQTVRLLRMPANHSRPFYMVHLECMLYDWVTDSAVTTAHEVNFYEGPTLTAAVTVGFRFKQNFTDFVVYLGQVNFVQDWCVKNDMCIQAVVAPVRSPELEYPDWFESAAAFNRTPLTDLLNDLRVAEVSGQGPGFLFHVNFVLRLSLSSKLGDLCNPRLPACSSRLLRGRQSAVLKFSEAAVETLDKFADERATVRKLKTQDQVLVETPADALNFSLRLYSVSLCPPGFGPADMASLEQVDSSKGGKQKKQRQAQQSMQQQQQQQDEWRQEHVHQHNGTEVLCLACPPGTHGSNGRDCFAVPNDHFTEGWGSTEVTPCPDYFITESAGASLKSNCSFNGTTPEQFIMEAMRLAWQEIEAVFYGSMPGFIAAMLIAYLFFSAYALFWQLHRLVTLMQYKHRRGMSDRLLKRFIAEAFLRDLRRKQYWHAALNEAKTRLNQR